MEKIKILSEKLIYGGQCIGKKNDGKVVFINNGLPNEELEVSIIEDKKDFAVADVVKVLKPSPFRTTPFCKYYGECGGCNLQHATEEYQKELRINILKDAFQRCGFIVNKLGELPSIEYIGGSNKNYRNRFQFSQGGLKKKSSNEVIEITECDVADKLIKDFIKNELKSFKDKDRLQVFASEICSGKNNLFFTDFSNENSDIVSVNLCGKDISFNVKGFFQSNLEVLEKMLPVLTKDLKGKNLLDMYAGVGTLSSFCCENFENVTLVEHNKHALEFAKSNLNKDSKSVSTYGMDGLTWVKLIEKGKISKINYDAVIIDPPRTGMEKPVLNYLINNKIPIIRSVSCNPVTHARDIAALVNAGYKLEKLFLLDFYPNTSHVESMAFLCYNNSNNN